MTEKQVKIETRIKPPGMKDSLLDVTKKFLIDKNRRYFGIAGASLQNQLDDPKYVSFKPNSKIINIGISGEKKTSKILRKWISDKPECILVDSISLPINDMEPEIDGEEGQLDLGDTDHLLIIGSNLIIIDSKNWKAKASYSITEEKEILRSKKSFAGNRPRIQQAKYLWEKFFSDLEIDEVHTFVCISDEETFITRDRNWWTTGYKLVNQTTLIYFLDKLYERLEEEEKNYIRVEIVAQTLSGLVKPYDKYKEKFGVAYNIATGRKA